MLQHAAAYMQHTGQIAAYCLNQDSFNTFSSNLAFGGYFRWQSGKKGKLKYYAAFKAYCSPLAA